MKDRFNAIYPKPSSIVSRPGELFIKDKSGVCGGEGSELLIRLAGKLLKLKSNSNDYVISLIRNDTLGADGSYQIEINDRVEITGAGYSGIVYGIHSLIAVMTAEEGGVSVPRGTISDSPYKGIRGVHFYLPPADRIDEFCRMLDVISSLRYNMIFLETGGGVQYDSHPEVNSAWMTFCRAAREFPKGPQGLQGSEAYWKDATHVELAGGSYLTKQQLRRIADHAASLGIEIVPEIQGLSHAYYLTLAFPEIAERQYEKYPDTYCPMNERSYQLYFELAEEVLEIFKPKRVSIGHDEVRILGECPVCRNYSGHELLARDINKLYDFYEERGIEVMMWGEKLQNFINWKGVPTGGVEIPERIDRFGRKYSMPATYKAIDMVPKDILMLDWYYSQASDTEKGFLEAGFNEIFGNFHGTLIADWERRSKSPNVLGAEVSMWCVPVEYEVGYNGWFPELVFSAAVLWRSDYTDAMREQFAVETESRMPQIKEMMAGERQLFDGTLKTLAKVSTPNPAARPDSGEDDIGTVVITPGEMTGTLDKAVVDTFADGKICPAAPEDVIEIGLKADALVFFHAAENTPAKRRRTWFFLDKTPMIPAHYAIDYEDGMCITYPVEFAVSVGDFRSRMAFVRPTDKDNAKYDIDETEESSGAAPSLSPLYSAVDPWRDAAVYFNRWAGFETANGTRTVYATEWRNPYPDSAIKSVRLCPSKESEIKPLLFAVGAVK